MHIFLFGGTTEGRKIANCIAEINEEKSMAGLRSPDATREKAFGNPTEPDGFLSEAKRPHIQRSDFRGHPISHDFLETDVFVATDYGASLLKKEKHVNVHIGRLDRDQMAELFGRAVLDAEAQGKSAGDILVIDATHPYANVVTENIARACEAVGVGCIRVHRPYGRLSGREMLERGSSEFAYFDSVKEAAEWLKTVYSSDVKSGDTDKGSSGYIDIGSIGVKGAGKSTDKGYGGKKNILITTGSKEIQEYTVIPDFSEYCYVRALPTVDVLEKCTKLGFRRDRLILMQGPFGVDMNLAQLRYADAGFLVTKDSGEIGGFPEKCDAAIELGVRVLVIGRPAQAMVPSEDWYQVIGLREVIDFLEML
ncbi:precorrin-6x reductase [Lachnospiraceae bacterium JC7]|nr:precorrin-6x reductase [Lachnospiraceae bacterium JC7]